MVMMRETPSLRVRPRPEVWDGAIQQPVVVVGLVERDKVLDGVDEVAEQWELLRRRRATVSSLPAADTHLHANAPRRA